MQLLMYLLIILSIYLLIYSNNYHVSMLIIQ